jgi:uncharacterized membrane protein
VPSTKLLFSSQIASGPTWWQVAVVATCAITLLSAIIFYVRVARLVRPAALAVLVGLRLAAVLVLILSLLEPVLSVERLQTERTGLAVVVDTSRSMGITDYPNLPSRLEQVQQALLAPGTAVDRLQRTFKVTWFAFDAQPHQLTDREALRDLRAEGEATNLTAGVRAAASGLKEASYAGVILFSDGQDNTEKDPVRELVPEGVPIYVVGVGTDLRKSGQFKDVVLADVDVPPTLPVNHLTTVTAKVEAVGLADRVVPVELRVTGGEVLATERIALDDVPGAQEVPLQFRPRSRGPLSLTVTVAPQPEETLTENNTHTVSVTVTEPRVKTLYLEGTVRSEYRYLVRNLQRDPNVELLSLVQVQPGRFLVQGHVEDVTLTALPTKADDLKPFDCIILGDLPVRRENMVFLSDSLLAALREWVRQGGGLLLLGGYNTLGPGGYGGTSLEDALPVTVGPTDVGQEKEPFALTLTAEGEAHPVFSGCLDYFPGPGKSAGQALPELRGHTRVAAVKPGASVLAVNPTRSQGGQPLPILAVEQFGSGHSAVFAADTTWQWEAMLEPLGHESPYVKFWGQLLRWLAGREAVERKTEPGIWAYTDKSFYKPGESTVLRAEVRDLKGNVADGAQVTATVAVPGGGPRRLDVPHVPRGRGLYELTFEPPVPGAYTVALAGRDQGQALGEATVAFQVGKPNLELERLDLNEALLRRLAQETRGEYLSLANVSRLEKELTTSEHVKRVYKQQRLYNTPAFFFVFLGLLTAEWALRKRWQLI